ncbi:MAG TPA: TolC family protein [Thermoanaerobaculia bacterium]|nr:TolC family protein [Thermoanaerobaculia bacterium]
MKLSITVIACGLLVAAGSALAQNAAPGRATPPDPALDALVSNALGNAPELAVAHAAVEAAVRRIEPARTLGDSSLSATYQNDGRSPSLGKAEGSFIGLMLSQPLPWPGKLALAGKAAESEAREIESGTLGRAGLTIEARIRNGWYDLILARALDRLIEERRDTARQIEVTTRDRYAAGLAVQQDVLRAQVELARIDELKATQRAVIASRLAELNRLLGHPQDAALDTPADLPAAAAISSADGWIAGALGRSPEAAAARQGIETGNLRVAIAKKNFLPDFVVSGGSMYRGNFAMGPMWQVGMGISLPVWSNKRQQNQLAEARARVAGQTAQSDVISRELELRTRERIAQLETANDVAALYRDKIVPLDQLSYESALASYQAGKVPFITVFEAVNVLYSDRASYLGRLAEAAKWRVAIDEAE